MKKAVILLLTLFICTACIHVMAEYPERETYESEDFLYALLDDGTAETFRYNGDDMELAIPSELDEFAVTTIGKSTFADCYVEQVTIPDSVTTIESQAFSWCYPLTRVIIPDSVTDIEANPFMECANLTDIIVSPDHPVLATIDGVLFSKPDKRLICYPSAFTSSDYSIPQGIQIIGDGAFSGYSTGCDSLIQITIPDSVTDIGDDAFSYCSSLTSIIVGRDSYAKQYCIDHDLPYTCADAIDWLNN